MRAHIKGSGLRKEFCCIPILKATNETRITRMNLRTHMSGLRIFVIRRHIERSDYVRHPISCGLREAVNSIPGDADLVSSKTSVWTRSCHTINWLASHSLSWASGYVHHITLRLDISPPLRR
jgi:hypothetical protein